MTISSPSGWKSPNLVTLIARTRKFIWKKNNWIHRTLVMLPQTRAKMRQWRLNFNRNIWFIWNVSFFMIKTMQIWTVLCQASHNLQILEELRLCRCVSVSFFAKVVKWNRCALPISSCQCNTDNRFLFLDDSNKKVISFFFSFIVVIIVIVVVVSSSVHLTSTT